MSSSHPRERQARKASQDVAPTPSISHGNTPSAASSSGWRSPSPEWLVSVSPINYPSSPSNKIDFLPNSPPCDPASPENDDVPQTTSLSDTRKVHSKRKRSLSSASPVIQPPIKRNARAAATVLLVPGPPPERHPSISAWKSMNFLWSCIEVTQENATKLSAIPALDGFLYPAEENEQRGTRQLFVHYMALAAYFLAVGQEVNVEVISWKNFLQVIKTTPERLYVYTSVFIRVTDEVDDLSTVALLDDLALRRTFRSEMLQLVDKTILLPPLGEFEFAAKTFGLIKLLNRIAKDDTHTLRPKTVLFNKKQQEVTGEQYVLKREGHHCRSSPIVVREGDEPPDVDVAKGFRWMKQEHVPCMAQSPEWRVYLVQEKVVAVIPTKKDRHGVWRVVKSMNIWSVVLRNERAKREESTDSEAASPSFEPGSELDRRTEVRAVTRFAETTIHALVLMEEKTNGRVPSISQLCRLDVGLYEDPKTGVFTHWVNSVARGAHALMYSVLDGDDSNIIEILEAVETMLRQLNEAGKYKALKHEPVRFAEPLSLYI